MTSFAELGNASLSLLGEYDYITALDDATPQAVAINANYDRILEYCLRNHFWNFAVKRVQIAASATAPAWGAGKHFPMPSDFIRVYEIDNDRYQEYQLESEGLYWEGGTTMNLRYIYKVTDPNKFDSLFREYYVAALARAIAPTVTDSREKLQEVQKLERLYLSEARAVDGDEDGLDRIWADSFIHARE